MKLYSLSYRDADGRPKPLLRIAQALDALGVRQVIDVRCGQLSPLDPRSGEALAEFLGHGIEYRRCQGRRVAHLEALARLMPSAIICACPLRSSGHRARLIATLTARGHAIIALDSSAAGCALGSQRELF